MGIRISKDTKKKETLKLVNHLASFIFEEEYEELNGMPKEDITKLRDVLSILSKWV